jgi:hypothetical protein
VQTIGINSVLRDHVHEFPHTPGGQPEKMGRKVYEVTMTCPFYSTFPKYPGLWPDSIVTLQEFFAEELTDTLVIPTFGHMTCYIRSMRRTARATNLAGEDVEFTFVEDSAEDFEKSLVFLPSSDGLSAEMDNLSAVAADDRLTNQELDTQLNTLQDGINSFLAISDSADVFLAGVESKILSVSQTCAAVDSALSLNRPGEARIMDALQQVWGTVTTISNDLLGKKTDLRTYVTPARMSMPEVSAALYGDNTHAVELLNLNDVPDAFAIPANTSLRYYPAT